MWIDYVVQNVCICSACINMPVSKCGLQSIIEEWVLFLKVIIEKFYVS